MKKLILYFSCVFLTTSVLAQSENETEAEEKKGFKKENLFSGGSVSFSFFNKAFLIGANPVFGYSLTRWADAGIVGNINYSSQNDYGFVEDAKLRQTIYGGGVFTRLFPVKFLFAQAQFEHNIIRQKYMPPNNGNAFIDKVSGNSFLVGGGYTTGRNPDAKNGFFYLSILFDISDNQYSPYKDESNRVIPIIRAGFHIPLFRGEKTLD